MQRTKTQIRAATEQSAAASHGHGHQGRRVLGRSGNLGGGFVDGKLNLLSARGWAWGWTPVGITEGAGRPGRGGQGLCGSGRGLELLRDGGLSRGSYVMWSMFLKIVLAADQRRTRKARMEPALEGSQGRAGTQEWTSGGLSLALALRGRQRPPAYPASRRASRPAPVPSGGDSLSLARWPR